MGEALWVVGDLGRDPVHHGAASPSTQTVNPPKPISAQFATEPGCVYGVFSQVIWLLWFAYITLLLFGAHVVTATRLSTSIGGMTRNIVDRSSGGATVGL
jgi:hypothetical protein